MLGSDSNNRGAIPPGQANLPGTGTPSSPYAPGGSATPSLLTAEAANNVFMKKENLTQFNQHIKVTAQNVSQFAQLFATLHA